MLLLAPWVPAQADTDQRRSTVRKLVIGEATYLAQTTAGSSLRLTADAAFFDGKKLRAIGAGDANLPGAELNKGKAFARVQGIGPGNTVSWFVHLPQGGSLTMQTEPQGAFNYELDGVRGGVRAPTPVQVAKPGVYRLRISSRNPSRLDAVVLSGTAVRRGSLLRARWRPKAAHTRFGASTMQAPCKVWVMELDALPGAAGFYAPMTTPFGYFGATWDAAGRPTKLNFSMWSYGRGQSEPALEQLSHLIALGDPKGRFGGFGHEGTGVKPRDSNPFLNWQHPSCVFALRHEPGERYDTYYGYYYHPETASWRLYAAGRKVRKARGRRAKGGLWAGSFVEVPGPPAKQRTGHIRRTMRYRGFAMDIHGGWHPFDSMRGEGKASAIANRGRGLTADGRFEMWMGGMAHFGPNPTVRTKQPLSRQDLPWMDPAKLASILTVPTEVQLVSLSFAEGKASLRLRVRGAVAGATGTIFYGDKPGRTFANRWDHRVGPRKVVEGEQTWTFSCTEAPAFARVLVQHRRGQYWSLASVAHE